MVWSDYKVCPKQLEHSSENCVQIKKALVEHRAKLVGYMPQCAPRPFFGSFAVKIEFVVFVLELNLWNKLFLLLVSYVIVMIVIGIKTGMHHKTYVTRFAKTRHNGA